MLAREVEISPPNAGGSNVASSPGKLTPERKMKDESHIGEMLAREVEISSPNAGGSNVASSPGNLTPARKMKDESHIVGREKLVDELMLQLINKENDGAILRVICVVGDKAVGKTALVRSVYNLADIKNHFNCCAWVRVGVEPNPGHLMVDLLKQLRVPELRDVDRLKEEELFNVLQGVLMECCFLVVLDDLRDLHIMDKLIMVLADSRNGSRVIVTTRNRDIPSSTDPWYSKHLELSPLDKEQSDRLLEDSSGAFDVVNPPVELLHLKEKIFSKSGGSPLKILLLGGLLSATTSDRYTELANVLPDHPTLQDVVRLSLDNLQDQLKQCALYLTLFPKESEIPTRRLFRLWSASVLENGENRDDAEKCSNIFKILVSRNMVHVARQKWDGSARSCRLPGTLYDVFYQMAKNKRFLKIYDSSIHEEGKFDALHIAIPRPMFGEGEATVQENAPEAGREHSKTNAQEAEPHQRMSIRDNSTPCSIKQFCSCVSFNTMKLGTQNREIELLLKPLVPKQDSPSLRVLDLEGVYKPLLPEELCKILLELKYLGLRWTLLESLPKSVMQLPHLETLDLKYTNISEVPVSIWEAVNLQHLYMNEVSFEKSIHSQLHLKKSLNCNIQTIWGLYIGVKSPMLNALGMLTGLRKLALTCHPSAVREVTEQILKLTHLKSLRLRSKNTFGQPSVLKLSNMQEHKSLSNLYLLGDLSMQSLSDLSMICKSISFIPRCLEVLTLSMSELKQNSMEVIGKLEKLTTLRLFGYSYRDQKWDVLEGTFPRLHVLKLWKLEELEELSIQANAMPILKDLEIKDCKKLEEMDGLGRINKLEGITLVKVQRKLEQSIRNMCPSCVGIIVKESEKCLPQNDIETSNQMEDTAEEEETED